MKIIQIDNYNRDNVSDNLIASEVPGFWAEKIVKFLNENTDPNGPDYYKVVSDEYVLYKWEP